MERRSLQVLDMRAMKNLKGGKKNGSFKDEGNSQGGGLPPNPDQD